MRLGKLLLHNIYDFLIHRHLLKINKIFSENICILFHWVFQDNINQSTCKAE